MSLETVLQIGKVLRNSENSLKYFKYVEPCPKDKDGNWPICITIPVKEDFSFDWEGMKMTPEKDRESQYYLKFKTSDADGFVKYILGDIFYSKTAKIKKDGTIENGEGGYYRLENPNHSQAGFRPSSFNRGNVDYNNIVKGDKGNSAIKAFREKLKDNLERIEAVLNYLPAVTDYLETNTGVNLLTEIDNTQKLYDIIVSKNYNQYKKKLNLKEIPDLGETDKKRLFGLSNYSVFIHFEFPKNKHWYHFSDELNLITEKILSEFVESSAKGQVLKKTLYKTLCSGDSKNDIQFPMFTNLNKYKAKSFSNEDLQDLFYAIDYTSKGKQITGTDIKLIVLPCGSNLTAENYEEFQKRRDENRIISANDIDYKDDNLFGFSLDENTNITKFDLIFCKKGGLTSPDSDLIEISGIEKSKLRLIMERISNIATDIQIERKEFIKTSKDLFPLKIDSSFRSILGNPQYDEKKKKVSFVANSKYQSHLLKTLPLIYTETYYKDDILLSAFIQNVEYSIRAGDSKYNFLKYDLKFLLSIQNNNSKTNKYMETVESKSYQIGLRIGKLSRPLKNAINPFEKRYVGLLSRHIMTKDDCESFVKEINEMLIRQGKVRRQLSSEAIEELVTLSVEEYDREKFAIGFLEGYFKYEVNDDKKVFITKLEKIITDYEGKNDFQNEIKVLTNALEEIK